MRAWAYGEEKRGTGKFGRKCSGYAVSLETNSRWLVFILSRTASNGIVTKPMGFMGYYVCLLYRNLVFLDDKVRELNFLEVESKILNIRI